jgi:hypothetical protein
MKIFALGVSVQTGRVNGASERGQERSSMSGQWGRRPEQLAYRFGRQTESHGNLLSRRLAAHHVPQVPAVRKIVLKTRCTFQATCASACLYVHGEEVNIVTQTM